MMVGYPRATTFVILDGLTRTTRSRSAAGVDANEADSRLGFERWRRPSISARGSSKGCLEPEQKFRAGDLFRTQAQEMRARHLAVDQLELAGSEEFDQGHQCHLRSIVPEGEHRLPEETAAE